VESVPYRLPELMRAVAAEQPIFIVEGERKVDMLRDMGLAATCCPMGAGKWPEHFVTYFAGANVAVLPDRDKEGRNHAHDVAGKLHNGRSIKIVELPGLTPKEDVVEWKARGGTVHDLLELAEAAPPWDGPPTLRTRNSSAQSTRTTNLSA
jgi:putative DNA primase/helicase